MNYRKVLELEDVLEIVGVTSMELARMEMSGDFPRRQSFGAKIMGWFSGDIDKWLRLKYPEMDIPRPPELAPEPPKEPELSVGPEGKKLRIVLGTESCRLEKAQVEQLISVFSAWLVTGK